MGVGFSLTSILQVPGSKASVLSTGTARLEPLQTAAWTSLWQLWLFEHRQHYFFGTVRAKLNTIGVKCSISWLIQHCYHTVWICQSVESLLKVSVGFVHYLKHTPQLFLSVEQNLPTHVLPNECHTYSAQSKVRGANPQYTNSEALHLHSSVNLELSFSLVLEAFKAVNKSRQPCRASTAQAINPE